jgi:multisubunit Na+/H+ antiporter MnhB subunit
MQPRGLRRALIAVCVGGIAGMIVASVLDSPGGALTFGLVTAVAALGMILLTAVTTGGSALEDDDLGQAVEEQVRQLVAGGADEHVVRALLRDAIRLGVRRQV